MQRPSDFGYDDQTPVDILMGDTSMGLAIGSAMLDDDDHGDEEGIPYGMSLCDEVGRMPVGST